MAGLDAATGGLQEAEKINFGQRLHIQMNRAYELVAPDMMRRLYLTNPFARMLAEEPAELPPRIADLIARTFVLNQAETAELDAWIDAEDARYRALGK